ncbi:MAG: hypothetical protein LC753_09500 [Acidobacteria bacterium]|nr:hypothetical protein [Acidobacteriota bacterium]
MKKNLAKSSLILLCFSMAGRRLPFDYSTRYGSTPAEFLDSGSCGYHRFHHSVAVADMEGNQGSPPARRDDDAGDYQARHSEVWPRDFSLGLLTARLLRRGCRVNSRFNDS